MTSLVHETELLGLEIVPKTTIEEWAEMGRKIYQIAGLVTWHLADWAAFGEREYGSLKEFCKANPQFNYGSLRQYAWVASSVELSRRLDNLSFQHHMEVAALPARDQSKWLGKASSEGLSCVDLREQIRAAYALQNGKKSDGPSMKFGTKYAMDLSGWLTQQPSDFWTDHNKAFWKEQLKPVVEFYERL